MSKQPEPAEAIARIYHGDRNPDRATLPGVGLRDLTVAEWRALPRWLRRSVDTSGFYTRPPRRRSGTAQPATPQETEAHG